MYQNPILELFPIRGQIIAWNMDGQIPTDAMFFGASPPGCVGCSVTDGWFNPNIGFAEILGQSGRLE
jgi:hypothetical protein